jgi:type I site-specific restriction endonuclease
MHKLNLPTYSFRTGKSEKDRLMIFDELRKKYVVLTPEEWVRQNFIKFLINEKNFPAGLISVEMKVDINGLNQRSDIVCFDKTGKPLLIVECKAPKVKITEDVFNQAARYNMKLNTRYLIMTNGLNHYCCKIDYNTNSVNFLRDIPDFKDV